MGKQERAKFRKELEKLSRITGETDEYEYLYLYLEQSRRTAEAEDECTLVERLIVRNQVD